MHAARPAPLTLGDFPHRRSITTRWLDNDVYGHINNVVYYAFFDSVVNQHLIEQGFLDAQNGAVIGLVVESQCQYFRPIAFPDSVIAAMRVAHLGTSSVRYDIGLFRNDEAVAAAQGRFVHVYVDRLSRRPVPLPAALRAILSPLVLPPVSNRAIPPEAASLSP
jgi:acyl-CoA thioester hydrolase